MEVAQQSTVYALLSIAGLDKPHTSLKAVLVALGLA